MAGTAGPSGDDDLIAGINITPLVDVVLVLLIIFLITAPTIYQAAIKVQLPGARSGEDPGKSPLSFAITKDGALFWDREAVDWKTLEQRLAGWGARGGQETALISADRATPHGAVIRLMDELRTAGLTRIALNVESKSVPSKAEANAHPAAPAARRAVRTAGAGTAGAALPVALAQR